MLNILTPKHRYRVALLQLTPSLAQPERSEPFAVVVEGPNAVLIMGQDPDAMSEVSSVGQAILANIPQILRSEVSEALEQGVDIIDYLSRQHHWTVSVSQAEEITSKEDVGALAFQLFQKRVLHLPTAEWPEPKLGFMIPARRVGAVSPSFA